MKRSGWYLGVLGWMLVSACEANDAGAPPPQAEAGDSAGDAGGEAGSSSLGGTGAPGGGKGGAAAGGAGGTSAGASAGAGTEAGSGSGVGGAPEPSAGGEPGAGASAGGEAGASTAGPAVTYVSTLTGDLLIASLDPETGAPSLLPSSPVSVAGSLNGVAVSPNGKFVFVPADPARIDTYPIAADGSLPAQPSSSTSIDDDNSLLALALDPLGRFAYGVSPFSQTIYVFGIDAASGVLTPSAPPLLVGAGPTHRSPAFVAPDPSGHFVYVTQLAAGGTATDNGIRVYSVDQTSGALTELSSSPFSAGDVTAGALVFRPDGKFLFSSGGGLNAFAVDTDTGELELVAGSPFSSDVGSDPWAADITIDPRGKRLYISQFLQTNHITGFDIDAESGALEQLPGPPATSSAPYSIALGPGGRSLYAGDDNGVISVFRVSRSDGQLVPLDDSPFPFGGLEADFAFLSLP